MVVRRYLTLLLLAAEPYKNSAEIMLYMGFMKGMEIFGMLPIVCEFKVLTLFLDLVQPVLN